MAELAKKNVRKATNYAALIAALAAVVNTHLLTVFHVPLDIQLQIMEAVGATVAIVNIWANWEKNNSSQQ